MYLGRLVEAGDVDAVFEACKENNVCVEINAQPERLDLPDVYARHAAQMGLKVVIDTDAHTTHDLDLMRFGVSMARRGWLESADIHNTNTKDEIVQSRQVKE